MTGKPILGAMISESQKLIMCMSVYFWLYDPYCNKMLQLPSTRGHSLLLPWFNEID